MATPTFGTIKTKISRKLIDANQTAVSDADVGDAVNDAQRFWKQKPFWFNEGQANLTLDVNDPYILGPTSPSIGAYPGAPRLPSDFLYENRKDGFVIPYSNERYRLIKQPRSTYDDENINGKGLPYIYCYRNGNYEMYFYPDQAYTLTVNYIKDVADLVNADDTSIFTINADRLITYEALAHLFGEDREDDESGNKYFSLVDREVNLLTKRSGMNVATGRLSVDTIL